MASKFVEFKGNEYKISYTLVNNSSSKNMVVLHGWGSNKEVMRLAFSEYFVDYNHIYIDLPGFGESPNSRVIDSFDYAGIVDLFLKNVSINGVEDCELVMGHSFGGKIALLLNREVILMGSAGILFRQSIKVRSKIFLSKIFKWLGIKSPLLRCLKSEDVRNLDETMYSIFKIVVREDFEKCYKAFNKKVTIFWGSEDKVTPLKSLEVIRGLMSGPRVFILKGDHYFFLKKAHLIDRLYNGRTVVAQGSVITVTGKVQGVGFRQFTKNVADEMGVLGSVKNMPDGTVEIVYLGDDLLSFLDRLKMGNGRCEVSNFDIKKCTVDDLRDFSILR